MASARSGRPGSLWSDPRLLLIGVVILALALARGLGQRLATARDGGWHGLTPALGTAVYTAFTLAMTLGRLFGGRFVDRFGGLPVLCASSLVSAIGIAGVSLLDNQIAASACALLWGLGAALGFPVALSAAGQSGARPQTRVAIAATLGYIAFLVGPPGLGFLGQQFGLRQALIAVLVLVALSAVAAGLAAILQRRDHVAVGASSA